MRILIIPDIHGNWAYALSFIKLNKDSVDYVVTLGDYVDDFNESLNGFVMQQGFLSLVGMARKEPEKFRIILGNHDHSYISNQSCSGHHNQYAKMYKDMFLNNSDLLEPAVLIDGVLFSHAGVSLDWYERRVGFYNDKHKMDFVPKEIVSEYNKWDYNYRNIDKVYFDGNIRPLVNPKTQEERDYIEQYHKYQTYAKDKMDAAYDVMKAYFKDSMSKKFSVGNLRKIFLDDYNNLNHCGYSSSGNSPGESVIWIRPSSLIKDRWPTGIKCQVVGHTEIGVKKLKYRQHKLIVCDSKGHNRGLILDTENIGDDFEKYEEPKPVINADVFRSLFLNF